MEKRKRIKALLCIVLILFSYIATSIMNIGTITVYADSNDNRKLNLAIAEGKTRAEISKAIADDGGGLVDMNSMRCIALYLSNFYQPFVTSLTDGSDIAVSKKTEDDKEAEQQNQQMGQFSTDAINALTKYCGVNEEVAQILVKNTLKQSLDTCRNVYVKRSAIEKIMNIDHSSVSNTLAPRDKGKSYIGFSGFSREINVGKTGVWRVFQDNIQEPLGYNYDSSVAWFLTDGSDNNTAEDAGSTKTIKDYIEQLYKDGGSRSVNGTEYLPLTYFLYLTVIQYAANNASPASGDEDSKAILNFYWYDTDTNNMVTCFDAGGTCTQAFLLATNEIDTKYGVGTSLSSLDLNVFSNLSGDALRGDELRKATIFFNPIFVNWVGDLVINDGHNTFVMVPGCLNPYSMVTISNGRTDYLNGVSVKALTYKANDLLESAENKEVQALNSVSNTKTASNGTVSTEIANALIQQLFTVADINVKDDSIVAPSTDLYKTWGFYNVFYKREVASSDTTSKTKWIAPLVYDYDLNYLYSSYDVDLSGSNGKSSYTVPNGDTDKAILLSSLGIGYREIKLRYRGDTEKLHNCVVLYGVNGLKNYLDDAELDIGSSKDWSNFESNLKSYCTDKDYRKNFDKYRKKADVKALEKQKAPKNVISAYKNGFQIYKILKNSKSKTVNDTKVITKVIKGEKGCYDIATKASLPNAGKDFSFTREQCSITSETEDNNKDYTVGKIDGNTAMFTMNKYVRVYGDTSDANTNFDDDWKKDKCGLSLFQLMANYGLGYSRTNFGGDYITFPSLIWSTMLCSSPDFADAWSSRIVAGSRPVSSKTYQSSYFFLRLSGTKDNPAENMTGYKMHDQVVYYPDYSVNLNEFASAIKTANIFETEEMLSSLSDMSPYTSVSNGYGQTLKLSDTKKELYRNIFMTYAFAEFNYENALETYDENINVVDMKCNWDAFPVGSGNIDFTYIEDTTGEEIESFIYYLLHPTKGIAYLGTWFRNKIAGILLNIHESIVGSSESNYTTGMTKYLGNSSYTTMPKLTDIKLLDNILGMYKNIMIYLILSMLIIIFCFIVVGEMTIQRGIVGLFSFALLAFLPPYMINAAANISNGFSDSIFGTKFEYWAISQMETYMDIINISEGDAVITNNALELSTQVSLASASTSVGGESSTGYSGTMLKWMSPKKYACGLINQALQQNTAATSHATFLKSMVEYSANSSGTGQEFVRNADNALYLYRDYVDIYRYGSNSYYIDVYCGEFLNQGYNKLVKSYTQNNSTQSKKEHGVYNVWHAKGNGDTKDIPFSKLRNLTYSSGIAVSDVINVNYDFGLEDTGTSKVYSLDKASTKGVDIKNFKVATEGIKSTYAVLHGFLFNTFGNSIDENENGVNYFSYNNTRASTLLLSYAATIAQTQDALNTFREDVEKGKIDLTYSKFIKNNNYCYGIPHDSYYADIKVFNNFDTYYKDEISEPREDNTNQNEQPLLTNITATSNNKIDENSVETNYKMLSDFYYDLYTESPYFYFNYNIRDQLVNNSDVNYQFSKSDRIASKNGLITMWLNNNQDYFYNFSSNAGDGYGELRDFMNFHDFFYYVVPSLQPGIDLLYEWDKYYGYYLFDDCSLKFTNSGTIKYDGKTTNYGDDNNLESIISEEDWNELTEEDRYKLWHNYNVNLINLSYCSWLDTMEDCDYAKKETIRVLGQKYTVTNPLDPTTYFNMALEDYTDDKTGTSYKAGDIVAGRFMVFSRSEMKYYGLNWEDLTRVEQKIISVQDEVYKEALKLVNYKAVSDENLIHAFAMLETFIFNKEFSQKNITNDGGYIMYPQGYELKAFTYDAYLRLILAESSDNIDLEVEGTAIDDNSNSVEISSIYTRIMQNTSIFFGILLILNDLLAVYAIPTLKVLILLIIFFLSVSMLIASVLKLELNIINNFIKSIVTPLFVFTGSCLGLSFITSLFMSNGADYITEGMTTLSLGDPTMTLIIMIIMNCMYCYINIKLLVKCYKAMIDYIKTIGISSIGAMAGTFKTIGNAVSGKNKVKFVNNISTASSGRGSSSDEAGAAKRGSLNGVGAFTGGALASAGLANLAKETKDTRENNNYKEKLDFYNGVSPKESNQNKNPSEIERTSVRNTHNVNNKNQTEIERTSVRNTHNVNNMNHSEAMHKKETISKNVVKPKYGNALNSKVKIQNATETHVEFKRFKRFSNETNKVNKISHKNIQDEKVSQLSKVNERVSNKVVSRKEIPNRNRKKVKNNIEFQRVKQPVKNKAMNKRLALVNLK